MKKKQQQQIEQPQVRPGQRDMFGNQAKGQTDITDLMQSPSTLQHKTKPPRIRKVRVLSPDGFDIKYEGKWNSPKEARQACKDWAESYRPQGYYSTIRDGERLRIAIEDIPSYCTLVYIDGTPVEE